MKTLRLVLWIAVALVAGLLGWLTLEMTRTKEQVAGGPFGVPFQLVAQDGKQITEKAFTGKPTALFFGFTHCPEVCPTTLFELNGWLDKVDPDGSKLQAYFVTVDPERDTPEIIGQYVGNVSKRITGISGPPDKVLDMAAHPHADHPRAHTAPVSLLDAPGRCTGTIPYGENPDVAEEQLPHLLTG